jgi:hypothetical protein
MAIKYYFKIPNKLRVRISRTGKALYMLETYNRKCLLRILNSFYFNNIKINGEFFIKCQYFNNLLFD